MPFVTQSKWYMITYTQKVTCKEMRSMTKPDTPTPQAPGCRWSRFLDRPKLRDRQTSSPNAGDDPAGVAAVCFVMMGVIVLLRLAYDLFARLVGWD
jgi:hypothetical protein